MNRLWAQTLSELHVINKRNFFLDLNVQNGSRRQVIYRQTGGH